VRGPRVWLSVIAVSLLALILAWPLLAEAAARIVSPPSWSESSAAAPEAQRRAGRWKDALDLRLVQVVSASDADGFAETAAVFERNEPVSVEVMETEQAAVAELARVVGNVVGSGPPKASGLRTTASGASVAWAQWVVDDLAYECVLAPSGNSASVLVIAVPADEQTEHRRILDLIIDNLEGVSEPMPHFSLLAWRLGALLLWSALALALHAAMLRFVDQDHDHATAGRRAALINLVLVGIGAVAAHRFLVTRELAIDHAGSSVGTMTAWIVVVGIVVVGVHSLISSRFDRGVVQSAPSTGAFASGTYSRPDMIRVSRSGVRPVPAELAELSGSWPRPSQPGSPATDQDPSHSGRITIDRDELQ
jgi:hypothetical protein